MTQDRDERDRKQIVSDLVGEYLYDVSLASESVNIQKLLVGLDEQFAEIYRSSAKEMLDDLLRDMRVGVDIIGNNLVFKVYSYDLAILRTFSVDQILSHAENDALDDEEGGIMRWRGKLVHLFKEAVQRMTRPEE